MKSNRIKNRKSLSWSEMGTLTKTSFKEFVEEDSFMHGAALAYYATLALVPMIYLAITFFGKFVGQERVIEMVENLIEANIGISDISVFTDLMYRWNIGKGGSFLLKTMSIIALIITSTAMFNALGKSLNSFFGITPRKPTKKGYVVLWVLARRLISLGLMTAFTMVIIIVYFAQSVLFSISGELFSGHRFFLSNLYSVLEHVSVILINFLIFSLVFKYLSNALVSWKLATVGAFFTAILLYLGQLIINYYLSNYFFANGGGVAGTLMVILVWIFYTSQIIFLGAKYMAVYARMVKLPIIPK